MKKFFILMLTVIAILYSCKPHVNSIDNKPTSIRITDTIISERGISGIIGMDSIALSTVRDTTWWLISGMGVDTCGQTRWFNFSCSTNNRSIPTYRNIEQVMKLKEGYIKDPILMGIYMFNNSGEYRFFYSKKLKHKNQIPACYCKIISPKWYMDTLSFNQMKLDTSKEEIIISDSLKNCK